ncbi:MAG: protoheme IX farnesyltransferase [Betaproteobacteria bacterium]|nr:protoheme IX farnesyltransferase [Betaproteobacteria bacterium]
MTAFSNTAPLVPTLHLKARAFFLMCKPRVNALIVFTAVIGMLLTAPELPPLGLMLAATAGIALVSGAAAAVNCVIEQHLDARMARTRWRPLPQGEAGATETLILAALLGGLGLAILHQWVNDLTLWLTLATFLGYAVIYTVLLKPATPMNIVIGGASGAMPPVLGWAAVTGEVSAGALALFLIIFIWTPPHFWSLALYRREDYARAGLPMLPLTHGEEVTRLHILLYALMLLPVSLLPYTMGLSGLPYLCAALGLGVWFLHATWRLFRAYSDARARQTFRVSILYLTLLFAVLLLDHFLVPA